MNVLVTGSNGQLGNEIRVASAAFSAFTFHFTDVAELDICNKSDLEQFVVENNIQAIINCAAYTAVDKAEDDVDLCYKINCEAVQNIAEVALVHNIKIVHVSTDYVFDGTSHLPLTEEMPTAALGVYGKSKLAGENALMQTNSNAVIVRTSWLYSSFGGNFVKTMIKLGTERDTLNVIFDQVGTPTYAADLAVAILKILSAESFVPGIYHYSNEGVCSWYDFTKKIHKMAGVNCLVKPIETKDYPTRTPRPHYSVLNKSKIKTTYGIEIPYWEDSLEKCIAKLQEANIF